MKSIYMTIIREFKLIFRDGITLYLTISPALLALIFIFVFGSVQNASISLAVDDSLPQQMRTQLAAVADLEYTDDLEARVSGADSIAGVYMEDGAVKLLVEGNEAQGFSASRRDLVSAALGGGYTAYTSEPIEGQNSLAYTVSMTCIFLLALFIGGATLGLSGVSERESGVIRAISISPMSLGSYVLSKIIPAMLLGVVGLLATGLIIGYVNALPQLLLLALCSIFVDGMVIFLMITFADNQIAAVGVLKIVMPLFLVVGVSAVFIPESWRFIYYPLPMYWQYAAIDGIISGAMSVFSMLMILVTGFVWFMGVLFLFRRKIKMRVMKN